MRIPLTPPASNRPSGSVRSRLRRGATPLYQDLRYDYEANGNVWNIYDSTVASNAGDQHFSYDDLDRLTLANGLYGAVGLE